MIDIDGIVVLETTPIMDYTLLSGIVIGVGAVAMIFALILWAICHKGENYVRTREVKRLIGGVAIGAVIVLFGLVQLPCFYAETGRYVYTCVIDDEASFVELYEDYEIVDATGKIYTLEDRK